MTLVEDYGLDSPPRKLLLLYLLMIAIFRKQWTSCIFKKVIRFFEHSAKKSEVDFSNFKLGGVSYELEEQRCLDRVRVD